MPYRNHPPTLIAALEALSGITDRGHCYLGHDGTETYRSFAQLHDLAARLDRRLRARGVRPGDRVAVVLPDAADFVPTFLAIVRAGAVPVPCYPPAALGGLAEYLDTLVATLRVAEPVLVCTAGFLADVLAPLTDRVESVRAVVTLPPATDPELLEGVEDVPPAVPADPQDPVFLQFTSGSTAAPKGVVVTHGSLAANTRAIMRDGLHVRPDDSGLCWLPLYHDMGLIGFVLAPLFVPTPVTFLPTLAFLRRPRLWFEEIHRRRATITFAPNFGFGLAARKVQPEDLNRWDLSCIRVLGCGAEPINAATIRGFFDTFAAAGLRDDVFLPCYGMAEATLAMAFPSGPEQLRTDLIHPSVYRRERIARPAPADSPAETFVPCGGAIPGHLLGVVDAAGTFLPDRHVGEIVFRGPSLTAGYYNNPAATDAVLSDGWLRTGDLGYLADGRIVVTGRTKDVLVIRGRNVDPQHVEWAVEQVPGVRPGNVVAFTRPGTETEELVVALEQVPGSDDEAVRAGVRRQVSTAVRLTVSEVVLLDRGHLPKTSSGKVQRRRVRDQYLARQLGEAPAATRALSLAR